MAHQATGSSSSAPLCTICLEEVSDKCDRTVVKLKCSHDFHLDCIGSAFNATGVMQCPNCREIEKGVWRRFEDITPLQSLDLSYDNDDRHVNEMQEQPCEFRDCPVHGRFRGSPPSRYRTMIRELDLMDCHPNISHHSFSLHRDPATYVAEDSHNHQHNWANAISSHVTMPDLFFPASGAPGPSVNITAPPSGARSGQRREPIARLAVFRLGGSSVQRNGAPRSNPPSPRLPTSPYQQPDNDLPSWFLEVNRAPPAEPAVASSRAPPAGMPSQNQTGSGNFVHSHVQEGDNMPPSGSHPGDMSFFRTPE